MARLRKNDVFMIRADKLLYASISDGYMELLSVFEKNNWNSNYLLFKYLGNNICEEYYTGLKSNIIKNINDYKILFDSYDYNYIFYKQILNEINNTPFYISKLDIEQVAIEFSNNFTLENKIKYQILDNYENSKKNLRKSIEQIISIDYDYAYVENAVFELKRRISK